MYPELDSKLVSKFKDIDIVLMLIQNISKLFVKEDIILFINNATLNDNEVLNLLEHRLLSKIIFKNCVIKSTNFEINCKYFRQNWEFDCCKFENDASISTNKRFLLKVDNNAQRILSLNNFWTVVRGSPIPDIDELYFIIEIYL